MIQLFLHPRIEKLDKFWSNYSDVAIFFQNEDRIWINFSENEEIQEIFSILWDRYLVIETINDKISKETINTFRDYAQQNHLKIFGIIGSLQQTEIIRKLLLDETYLPTSGRNEKLFTLDLQNLVLPETEQNKIFCRYAQIKDKNFLLKWRNEYNIEVYGRGQNKKENLEEEIENNLILVLEDSGKCVSMTSFGSPLPNTIQVGGVYTPPNFRGRKYARILVSEQLKISRNQGNKKAVLFTNNPSAIRVYESIGFKSVRDYNLALFQNPIQFD